MAKKKSNVTATSRRQKVSQRSRDFYDPMQAAADLDSIQYTDVAAQPAVGQAARPGGMPIMGGGKSSSGGGAISLASGSQDRSSVKKTGNCRMVNGQMVCGYGPTTTTSTTVTSSRPAAPSVPITPMPSINAPDEEIEKAAAAELARAEAARKRKEAAADSGDYIQQNIQGGEQEAATIRSDRMKDLPTEKIVIAEAIKLSQAERNKLDSEAEEADVNAQLIREGTGEGRANTIDAMTARLIDPNDPETMSMNAYVEGRAAMAMNTYNQPNRKQNPDGTTELIQPQNPVQAQRVTEDDRANFRRQGISALQSTVVLSSVQAFNHFDPESQMSAPDKADVESFNKFSQNAAKKIAETYAASGQLSSDADTINTLIQSEVYDPFLRQSTQLGMELNAQKLAQLDAYDAQNGTNYGELQRREIREQAVRFSDTWEATVRAQINAKAGEIGGTYPGKPDDGAGGYGTMLSDGMSYLGNLFGLGGDDSQAAQQPDSGELTPSERDELERLREREMRRQEPNIMLAPDLRRRRTM